MMTMNILKGLLLINDIDPFEAYGAFLAEDKAGDTKNYSSLLKPAAVKAQKEVSFREQHGVKIPDVVVQRRQARDVTLQFAILAADKAEFMTRYTSFIEMLQTGKDGWLDFYFPEMNRHFRLFYREASDYKQLTDFEGEVAGKFSVKFREPQPTF